MARIGPNDLMPCGCPALRNAEVFRDGERVEHVVTFDTEARTAEVLVYRPDGRLSVVDNTPETKVVHGNLWLECKTHGRVS